MLQDARSAVTLRLAFVKATVKRTRRRKRVYSDWVVQEVAGPQLRN